MAKRREVARIQRGALTAVEAEELFATVDETGHTDEETARKQRHRRKELGRGVDIDPLSEADPSGSNVEKVITATAVGFVVVFFLIVVVTQVATGIARRTGTANLASDVTVTTVATALDKGVEWGNGFTQFPERFSVQKADENTHNIEVTVVDTSSKDVLEAFAGSQIQAAALSVNALLNPNIDTVTYHVNVYVNDEGKFQTAKFFGLIKPQGTMKTLMTFVWTKTTTETGVRFDCAITGLDAETQEQLSDAITTPLTPSAIIGNLLGTTELGGAAKNSESSSTAQGSTENSSSTDASGGTDPRSQTEESSSQSEGDKQTTSAETNASPSDHDSSSGDANASGTGVSGN